MQRPDRRHRSKAVLEVPTFSCRILALSRKGEGVQVSGRHSEGVTPVPIPNTAVKPFSADGTVPVGGTREADTARNPHWADPQDAAPFPFQSDNSPAILH